MDPSFRHYFPPAQPKSQIDFRLYDGCAMMDTISIKESTFDPTGG